jgi:hypothetical protein
MTTNPLNPGKYPRSSKKPSQYNISDTILDRGFVDREEVFRGSGTDYSELDTSVIYIASVPLKRVVALKAFIESAKYNITKTTDVLEEKDKNSKVFATFDGDLDIDVVINIPAHSTNEARNNLAKIEELQRLISPNSGYRLSRTKTPVNVDMTNGVIPSVFRVWFKNIISSGKEFTSYSTPITMDFNDIMKHGFPCVIDSVTYEPVLDAGFLELDNFLYPKVIKLNLKLIMEVSQVNIRELPIEGFDPNGNYSPFDNKFFPFCVDKMSTEKMNELDYGDQGTKNNAFFMSLEVEKSGTWANQRWVQFKPFLESFTRTHGTSITYAESKERVGKLIASDQSITFKDLSYKFKLLIPAKDLAESKRNCAKIQYLMRMFYRPPQPVDAEEIGDIHTSSNGSKKKEYVSLSNRRIKVYSPSFIEKAGAAEKHNNLTFEHMYQNGISMFLNSLSVDVNFDVGFFEEAGKLYPKEMSIDLDFIYDSNDLIKTYVLETDTYSMQSSKVKGWDSKLFPYNRQTSTIKLGK